MGPAGSRARVERLERAAKVEIGVTLSNSEGRRARLVADKLGGPATLAVIDRGSGVGIPGRRRIARQVAPGVGWFAGVVAHGLGATAALLLARGCARTGWARSFYCGVWCRCPIWGLEGAASATELIVSELVTSAIRYGKGPIRLRMIRQATLICEVFDASSTAPHLRRARTFDEAAAACYWWPSSPTAGAPGIPARGRLSRRNSPSRQTGVPGRACDESLPSAVR
ncbi:hypothetical protein Stsp01_13340 [Streptomyces sp. NBRC 13847]|nr:hypothetical protein Stsp01_13340 [Streptomyces sp. NBRC 13847]